MMEHYDVSKASNWMTYLDANILYVWAMSQALPTAGFEWVAATELQHEGLTLEAYASKGYFLEGGFDNL